MNCDTRISIRFLFSPSEKCFANVIDFLRLVASTVLRCLSGRVPGSFSSIFREGRKLLLIMHRNSRLVCVAIGDCDRRPSSRIAIAIHPTALFGEFLIAFEASGAKIEANVDLGAEGKMSIG